MTRKAQHAGREIRVWVPVLSDGSLAALPDDSDVRAWLKREDAIYDALGFHNAKAVRATLVLPPPQKRKRR